MKALALALTTLLFSGASAQDQPEIYIAGFKTDPVPTFEKPAEGDRSARRKDRLSAASLGEPGDRQIVEAIPANSMVAFEFDGTLHWVLSRHVEPSDDDLFRELMDIEAAPGECFDLRSRRVARGGTARASATTRGFGSCK